MKKIPRTAKIGRGRRPSPIWLSEEFFESNYFQIGQACSPLGSITSRCSGKEPALLPRRHGWTREDSFVSPSQSVNRPQIFVGHALSRQLGLRSGMADDVELINVMRKNFRDS